MAAWIAAGLLLAGTGEADGGTYTRSAFPLAYDNSSDSNLTATAGGVGLAVDREKTIKLSDDQVPDASQKSYYPDVAACGVDTFLFFFVDTTINRVLMQGVRILPDGNVFSGTAGRVTDINPPRDVYLHVDRGDNGFCASYVQRGTGLQQYLQIMSGSTVSNIDSAQKTEWLFPSQCAFAGDTFLVIAGVDKKRVMLYKVYARGNAVSIVASDTVATRPGTGEESLTNCSVAADRDGTILATAVKGNPVSPTNDKHLIYQFYHPDLSAGPSGTFAGTVSDREFTYYDDAPVAAYGPGRFACVTWDDSGVVLHRLTISGNTVRDTTDRAVRAAGVRYCTVAANTRFLVIACHGDVDGNGIACVEGLMYRIDGYKLESPETVSFSDPSVAVQVNDRFSTAINCAVDDSGTVALTWRNGERVYGCIWSHRAVRHRRGFYTSPVESLAVITDSLQFNPAQVTLSSTASWFTEDSLRFGATPVACMAAPWISLSSSEVLRNNRMREKYFQFRITINRRMTGAIDSLSTPTLSAVTLPWNTQPRCSGIDSVTAGTLTYRAVTFGDTVGLVARRDTAHIALHGYDGDGGGTMTFAVSLPSTPSTRAVAGGPDYYTSMAIRPIACAGAVLPCTLAVQDGAGWAGEPQTIYLKTGNPVPQLSLHLVRTPGDTVPVVHDTAVVLQEEDDIAFIYAVADSNDAATVRGYVGRSEQGSVGQIDSTTAGSPSVYMVHADTVSPADTLRLLFTARDPDTAVRVHLGLLVNHRPRIRNMISHGDTLAGGDTLNVSLDDTAVFIVAVDDTDCAFEDTLFYCSEYVARHDSTRTPSTEAQLRIVPDAGDTIVRIRVTDRFGRSDSAIINLAYPWYDTGSATNPGYGAAKKTLAQGLSLIDGSSLGDTVIVPLRNSGRNRMRLTGCSFSAASGPWLTAGVDWSGDPFTVSAGSDSFPREVLLQPDSSVELAFLFSAGLLSGDSVRCGVMLLFTDDSRHRCDTFVVCLEHNDLPRIVSVNPDFIADRPYRPPAKRTVYSFPPHAAVAIAFSEPMDSAAAAEGIRMYSVTDARRTGSITPIPLGQVWLQNYTVVHLSPRYASASPSFSLMPPPGLFIPTDSLALILSSDCRDRARTPGGPNPLDVDRDFMRDDDGDTAIGLRVDSIDFTVTAVDPVPGSTGVARTVRIGLDFSSPVYAASVDTSLQANRSLIVRSEYNGGAALAFSQVAVERTRVVFSIARELLYRDSLTCFYRSRWVRDRLGYATDNDGNGIDATMFDTAAHDDDIAWGYRIKEIAVTAVEPDSGAVLTDISPQVTIRFNDRVPPELIDFDTSAGNRSFRIGSTRTGWSSFVSIEASADGESVILLPKTAFYSNDSIYCQFTGFPAAIRYDRSANLPEGSSPVFGSYQWYFHSGEIGFYTYPNPYKPGTNPRHCSEGGPCGIWFKNLHTLADNVEEVTIAIHNVTAHPVFDSWKAGERIRFGAGTGLLPRWLWNTRNNRGDLVASGIYLYAVRSLDGSLLQRGKLIIVR